MLREVLCMYGYVYKTTNLINGKIYVGQHKSQVFDEKYFGSGFILKRAISKYGIDNFRCEILQIYETKEDLESGEIYWISKLDSCNSKIGYNRSYGGYTPRYHGENHPMYGRHHTAESKEKNRISHTGKKQSVETIEKRISTLRGKPLSEEHKAKISEANKGKPYCGLTEDGRRRISEASKSRVVTEETRKKLSVSNTGKKRTAEQKKKLSESHLGQIGYWTGKNRDDATKQKISNSLKGKPNYRERIKFYVDDMFFNGLDEGAEFFGITKSCMSLWVKRGYTRNKRTIVKVE